MRAKLGLTSAGAVADALIDDLLPLLRGQDYTSFFRALSAGTIDDAWTDRWREQNPDLELMNRVNPVYIPRNHLVEEALAAATNDDLEPFNTLLDVLTQPFVARPGLERFAEPAPPSRRLYQTFCGT